MQESILYASVTNIAYGYIGQKITVRDVCKLYSQTLDVQPYYDLVLCEGLPKRVEVDAIEILGVLSRSVGEDVQIQLMGSDSCSVRIKKQQERAKVSTIVKGVIVALLLFFGGAMTLINYHTDAGMAEAHSIVSQSLGGGEAGEFFISLFYSIGIALGIAIFAGVGRKRSGQPNMLDLETMEYEQKLEDFDDMQKAKEES